MSARSRAFLIFLGRKWRQGRFCQGHLSVNQFFGNYRLQDDGRIRRDQVGHLSKGMNCCHGHGIVSITRIHFTHVNLLQRVTEGLQNQGRLTHRWIDLPSMANVKAERRIREDAKYHSKLFNGSAYRFSLIHVFDAQRLAEISPDSRIDHGVRVNNDRPVTMQKSPKDLGDVLFRKGLVPTGCMERKVGRKRYVDAVQ